MSVRIVSRNKDFFTIQIEVPYGKAMATTLSNVHTLGPIGIERIRFRQHHALALRCPPLVTTVRLVTFPP